MPIPRKRKWLLTLLVAGMFLLHQDCWNWHRIKPLLFGFLPVGLTYHALYMLLASAMMWTLVRFAWPAGLDAMEGEDTAGPGEPSAAAAEKGKAPPRAR